MGELNRIYNFQDTIILSELLKQIFKYNKKKCNSASSFYGCFHPNKSKCSIALPADAEFVRVFEKTLIGGFSCINTRLAFDTDILVKNPESEKVLVEIENNEGQKQLKRFSSKIIKMDENNQYGQVITKPLPYGSIKKQKEAPTLNQLNKILDAIDHNDTIGHVFTVDIKFSEINEKTLLSMKFIRPYLKKAKR